MVVVDDVFTDLDREIRNMVDGLKFRHFRNDRRGADRIPQTNTGNAAGFRKSSSDDQIRKLRMTAGHRFFDEVKVRFVAEKQSVIASGSSSDAFEIGLRKN